MSKKIRKLVQVCFFDWVKVHFFQIEMAWFLKVVFRGEAPGNIVYVLAKTTHDTCSGKGPENRLPETSSINILLFS